MKRRSRKEDPFEFNAPKAYDNEYLRKNGFSTSHLEGGSFSKRRGSKKVKKSPERTLFEDEVQLNQLERKLARQMDEIENLLESSRQRSSSLDKMKNKLRYLQVSEMSHESDENTSIKSAPFSSSSSRIELDDSVFDGDPEFSLLRDCERERGSDSSELLDDVKLLDDFVRELERKKNSKQKQLVEKYTRGKYSRSPTSPPSPERSDARKKNRYEMYSRDLVTSGRRRRRYSRSRSKDKKHKRKTSSDELDSSRFLSAFESVLNRKDSNELLEDYTSIDSVDYTVEPTGYRINRHVITPSSHFLDEFLY